MSTITTLVCYVPSVIFCLLDGILCAVTHILAYWTYFTVTHVIFFIIECGIAHFLCTVYMLCMYSTFGHHPHPPGYSTFVSNFVSVAAPIAELARGKNVYSINQSLTHSAYLMHRQPKLSLWNNLFCILFCHPV